MVAEKGRLEFALCIPIALFVIKYEVFTMSLESDLEYDDRDDFKYQLQISNNFYDNNIAHTLELLGVTAEREVQSVLKYWKNKIDTRLRNEILLWRNTRP